MAIERVTVDRINQILSVAGFIVNKIDKIIVVLNEMIRISSIYKLKNCTLSLDVKGLCALYTNI